MGKKTAKEKMNLGPSRHNILHETIIDAPLDEVWQAIIKIDHWEWNKWTRLETESGKADTGEKGKLKASFEGDDRWVRAGVSSREFTTCVWREWRPTRRASNTRKSFSGCSLCSGWVSRTRSWPEIIC